jgi:hypothetical protein
LSPSSRLFGRRSRTSRGFSHVGLDNTSARSATANALRIDGQFAHQAASTRRGGDTKFTTGTRQYGVGHQSLAQFLI